MAPKMAPKKATKQSSITSMGFPLLQKPAEMCVGRQIQVLGSYWTGRMSNEEANSLYKCTVREYHALHKWDAGGTPSQAMELQEMGVDGQGSRETGGSAADRIFFMKYPLPFLQHWYATYPPPHQDTTTTGSSVVSPSSVGGDTGMAGERTSGVTDSKFPHMPPRKAVVFNYYTLVSDDLISSGPNSGQYTATFKCNIKDETGKVCGAERKIVHCKGKAVSTSNLIQHIEKTSKRCASHASVDVLLKNASPNYVTVNGERHKMYTFAESFTHHVDLLWAHGGGLSWNMAQRNKDFQQYVRGYDPRAKFPCHQVQHRLPQVVLELQQLERKQYITSLDKEFKGKECMGLQLDMWTNTESVEREQYACVMMTTVVDPVDTTAAGAQLRLRSDILDFNVFPYSEIVRRK